MAFFGVSPTLWQDKNFYVISLRNKTQLGPKRVAIMWSSKQPENPRFLQLGEGRELGCVSTSGGNGPRPCSVSLYCQGCLKATPGHVAASALGLPPRALGTH